MAMNFQFVTQRIEKEHTHLDVELFYVINGSVTFMLEGKKHTLMKDDFLMVNIDSQHYAKIEGDSLACRIVLPFLELNQLTSKNTFVFWCNSANEDGESYDMARDIIKKIIWEHYTDNAQNKIYITSLYYQLLNILVNDFLLDNKNSKYSNQEHKFDDRKQQIEDYMRQNYNKDISLQQLADTLYLSNAYLSKYIKKQFGMSFIEYVNTLRFNSAISQLLYSDKSVLRIAMDNGFSSSATLNKMFKEKYNKTPTEFRSEWRNKDSKKNSTVEEEKNAREKVQRFFEQHPTERPDQTKNNYETVIINENYEKTLLPKAWSQMINIGTASDLLKSNVQKHVLNLASELHFKYVRFWDLYAEEMFLIDKNGQGSFNFDSLDRIIDFLIDNNLKPYLELGNKPKILIKNSEKMLMYNNPDEDLFNKTNVKVFTEKMIIHLINRYTPEEVDTWFFELWKEEMETGPEKSLEYESSNDQYLRDFETISEILHKYAPDCNFGGAGFALRFGEEYLIDILNKWKNLKYKPDFISIYNHPYTSEFFTGKKTQSLDENYFKNHILRIKEILFEEGFSDIPLHVTEWSFSVSSRNVLNDHCMKGAYVMKNMIDCSGVCDLMGYWVGSDLYSNYYDSSMLLNGGSGLLSKDGIPKPSFYALDFMNCLGRYMLKRGNHYLVSSNSGQNFRIVCHNLKGLNYQYTRHYEDEITLENCEQMFVDSKKQHIHFELPVNDANKYFVRVYSVNKQFGSVQDEWSEMMAPQEMRVDDLRYLGRITTPRMYMQKCEEKNGHISIDVTLEPNEIMFMHVIRKY